eukprot:GSChrysophyteH2.ASY1.ANO1.179.1 assembled CDS
MVMKFTSNELLIGASLFGITTLYVLSASPTIAGGDSGELVAEGCNLGTAHPPGYPLFTVLTWVVKRFGFSVTDSEPNNVAYRLNVISCFLTAGAAGLMALMVQMALPMLYVGGSVLAMGLFAFSPLIWQYAVTAEVFPLNTFFAALILFLVLLFAKTGNFNIALTGAFVCGIALTNQHTIVLYEAPLMMWMAWLLRGEIKRNGKAVFSKLAAVFFLGLTPYVYMPWSAVKYPESKGGSWGNVDTWSGFWHHFLRRDYGTLQLYSGANGKDAEGFMVRTTAYLHDLTYTQGLYVASALALIGVLSWQRLYLQAEAIASIGDCAVLISDAQWTPLVLLLTQCFYFAIFHTLSNLPLGDKLLFGVHQRFWMQPNVLLFTWVGVGFNEVMRVASVTTANYHGPSSKKGVAAMMSYLSLTLGVLLVCAQYRRNIFVSDQSSSYHFRDYARAILDPLPKNSLLLVNYDMQWTSLRYVSMCEGYRSDVTLINLSMMTYTWFHEKRKLYPDYAWPGTYLAPPNSNHIKSGGAFTLTQFLDANVQKGIPIFLGGKTAHDDPELDAKYQLVPSGLVGRFVPTQALPDGNVFQTYVASNWQYVLKNLRELPNLAKYTEETWEWTIGRDFKDRLQDTASFYLEIAIPVADKDPAPLANAVYWLETALILEKLDSSKKVPTSLYKNAGLGHLHLVQNALLDDKEPLPLDGDYFNTAEGIGWPTRARLDASLAKQSTFDWKKWSADKFMSHWGEFLSRPDARKDKQYDTIKGMYDNVSKVKEKTKGGGANKKAKKPKKIEGEGGKEL